MDPALQKALLDRVYDRRKAATLDLEKQVREALSRNDRARVNLIVQQLCSLLSTSAASPQAVNARNGGLIGLAGIAIALGMDIAPYLEQIVPPVLACFSDPDSKIRYFACESFYNIAKVCKGEILIYFNETFDALSKLAADSELSVKNGAELLDRLLKDIVCEAAPDYVSRHQDIARIRARQDVEAGNLGGSVELDVAREKAELAAADARAAIQNADAQDGHGDDSHAKAFSLARFVPLLSERIYVISPFTRNYLVSWITVLDSIPNLELVSFLPHFLDGLLKYLSDPNLDVRVATGTVLDDLLRECKEAASSSALSLAVRPDDEEDDAEGEGGGKARRAEPSHSGWVQVRAPRIDYGAIMEILIRHISYPDEEIQATTLRWISEFIAVLPAIVVPFTPRLIPFILPSIAHHSPAIASAAGTTNANLYAVIENLPSGSELAAANGPSIGSPRPDQGGAERSQHGEAGPSAAPSQDGPVPEAGPGRDSREFPGGNAHDGAAAFEMQATVNELTLQLIDEHEETRVTALEWLLMLHRKAPNEILAVDDGTFPALLKTLSDPSAEVVRCDLRLLAQISSASEQRNDNYFRSFMVNLVSLFGTDRRLLETRGSLIVRQLCASLDTERIYRTLAEILERDEDLEFASIMVTNLNMILLTSPELSDFRRRLKNLDSRDGQQLFVGLYRSWSHNAVATFSLCLLAQAYEHASNLLQIFAELDITVSLLIQIDKLVQLLESPIFTSLRLQLLEPERYPYLFKCMYGLLMLLPQSSAFATLRNRLNAVSSMGFLHAVPRASATTSSSSSGAGGASSKSRIAGSGAGPRDDIRWAEMLSHFRKVQARHDAARWTNAGHADGANGPSAFEGAHASLVPSMAAAGLRDDSPGSSRLASSRRKTSGTSPTGTRSAASAANHGNAAGPISASSRTQGSSSSFFGLHLSGTQATTAASGSVPGNGAGRPTSPLSPRRAAATPQRFPSVAQRRP